ncbi:hydrophobe/amphiphile efflux-1 (HAE1) family protein [Mesorhizobium albiziae]|uniref:Hydrophobe/amphiphile efflux-1 (HAE1) family protein n=1 Tax=Neomesorhizobium albiziae TaxID=335020 RepID=A0A1I3ZYU2_9HYPH|nr:efflux RND transporter permease subunit [Mesorhizobium albiziae]GLS33936.1 ABC transporter permease [Mesorhizobium albiziae]SFK49100.1 hydrophobe/amphiphile efflux-1 (HAE1) family protein [Mesorhizobium albiziae]
MNWNFSAWSIRNPIAPILLFVVLIVLGLMSFKALPITRFPNIDVPLVSVVVTDPGVAPSELETQVTKRIEDAVSNISGVKNVMSTITEGNSQTTVEFRLEVDTQTAVTDVKDAVERIQSDLPATADDPVINRIDVEGQAILTYAVSAPAMTPEELSWFVDDTVIRKLQGLKGVARVDRYGGVTREIHIDVDPDRLNALGVTAGDINRAMRAANVDLTGGSADFSERDQSIRTLGGAKTLADLEKLEIPLAGDRKVLLSDIAKVTDSWEEPKSFARVNGQTVVSFGIFRGKGESDVEVNKRVEAAVADLQKAHPDVAITKVDDSVSYTEGNYDSAMETLLEGAILSVVVVFLFLRDIRATLVSAIALPLSILPAFWAIDMMGFSLNLVSLLGITLVVGILVDDAIVEIENIVRHIKMGKSPYRASLEAADEIGLAVIAISATIMAVFAPVSFMGGIAGQYFKQFGLTVAVAVFFSLLVARLITPMLAAYFLRSHVHEEPKPGMVMRGYVRLLKTTLRFRWLTLGAGIAFFAGSIYAMGFLPSGFIPKEDASRIVFSLELPPGSRLEDTRATTDEVTKLMREVPEVENVYVIGGSNPTGTLEPRRATVVADLKHKSERDLTQAEIEEILLKKMETVPDLRAYFVNDRGERQLAFGVMGTDGALLDDQSRKIQSAMAETGKFRAISSNAALDRPEIIVVPNLDRLAELGISTATLSETLRIATIGDIDENLAKFTVGDRQIPIRVQLNQEARDDLSVVSSLPVLTPSGVTVPLSSVADIRFGQGPSSIQRFNRERRVVISADMAQGAELGEGLNIVWALPQVKNMPAGTRIQETGDAEIMGEVFAGFATAMGTGLMLVLVVLILLFGSVFHSFTILGSLPLAIGGVVAGLMLTNSAVSMPVVIGILMLMGIVTKNAIMLVDFAVEEVKHGIPRAEAIIDAGRKRARPIVMTTIAMSAGMIPASLALGDGGEFRAPMAVAVVGGLLVSTFLSLIFVPSFYTIMDDAAIGTARLFRWLARPNEKDDPEDTVHASNVHALERAAGRELPMAAE